MTRFEVTKLSINMESDVSELESLMERIDVMYLANRFTAEEYLHLVDMFDDKMAEIEAMATPSEPSSEDDVTDSEETPSDENATVSAS